ncbi:ankyrin repeat-containing protein, putative [Talaromyces stipitatus ATCC 10500]|uniref:Ankyrin repeat-containing protein, putative n=1 Tax=Talaromyces stipitatus (strain ATCC 10500 / CBS 375.48 / QM 6759 / NRRL 1006) TaxID=441959 RepID=B8MD56_TALSN|nr:ankyrin repeat-containing protein, putative [Talaromyces stipitatus ATCC 10500]EED17581.1 ankyrin repeat-containing protein, putative [Talaromyces stipitatus ATCC 10500]
MPGYAHEHTPTLRAHSQLARLPVELILKIGSLLQDSPADLCHFAALTSKNWSILREECHRIAVKLAEPTEEEFKKYLTETGDVDRLILWDQVQESDIHTRSKFTDAVSNGKLNVVDSFLQHGLSPNTCSIFGNRPLNLAANCPRPVEMSKLLLKHGADPNLTDILTDIFSPLYTAASLGHEDLVNVLLDCGADIKVKSAIQAICHICTEATIVRAFEMGADIHSIDEGGNNILHHGGRNESPAVLPILFKLGCPLEAVNKQNLQGKTPLMKAVKGGHVNNVTTLLAYNADPNTPLANGATALHVACNWDHVEIARLLIDAGAKVEVVNGDGWRPIHFAAYNYSTKMVELLVQHGADVTATDQQQNTALHLLLAEVTSNASKKFVKGILRKVKLLISANADPTAKNDSGDTPLSLAKNTGHYEIYHLLSTRDTHALDGKPPTGRDWKDYLREHVYVTEAA